MSDFNARIKAELDLTQFSSQIAELSKQEFSLRKFKLDTSGLPSQIQGSLDKHKFTITLDAIKMKDIDGEAKKAAQKIQKSLQDGLETDKFQASIDQVTAKFEKFGGAGHKGMAGISQDIARLNSLLAEMKNASDLGSVEEQYKQFNTTLAKVQNNLISIAAQNQMAVNSLKVSGLESSMANWLNNNSRAAKKFGGAIHELQAKLKALSASGDLTKASFDEISNGFKRIQQEAKAAGLAGDTFGSKMGKALGNVMRYIGASTIFRRAEQILVQMATNVKNVDTAMTGLYRVTNLTDAQYQKMYSNMVKSAKQYGAELTSIIDATAEWSKLGFDANAAQNLANVTSMYQHVTDLPVETAVENLVTAYKGFEAQLKELYGGDTAKAVEYVADILNELGKVLLPMKNYIG